MKPIQMIFDLKGMKASRLSRQSDYLNQHALVCDMSLNEILYCSVNKANGCYCCCGTR